MATGNNDRKAARFTKSRVVFQNCLIEKVDNDWAAEDDKERKITGSFQQNDETETKQLSLRFDSWDAIDAIYAAEKNKKKRYNLSGYITWYDVKDKEGNKVTRDKLVILEVTPA